MTPQTNEGLAQQPPCIMNHEEMYLHWCHQADGYSYFKCASCGWQKPDLELGTVGKIIKAKDTRIHSLEAEVEELKKALDHWTLLHIQESARSAKLEANLKIAVGALEKISRADDENHYGEEGLALMVCVETSKSALFRLKSGGWA